MAEQQQSFTPGEWPLYPHERELQAKRDAAPEMFEALKQADDAIREMFRYFDGGETRGSYDGRPERDQLRKAGYATRAALASAQAAK